MNNKIALKQHEEILKFISNFNKNDTRKEVIECFTQGCCYWFAKILLTRFSELLGDIVYDGVDCHFGYFNEITQHVYDITGDVTDKYEWQNWFSLQKEDPTRAKRIIHDSILMEEDNNE